MPKRARDRRTTPLDALAAKLDRVARPCIAIYIRDEAGEPFMLLMGDSCPTCVAFRAEVVKHQAKREAARPKPPAPTFAPPADDEELLR